MGAAITDPLLRNVAAGIAMGLTAIALIHSPWGKRSGAHFNPAVTIGFLIARRFSPQQVLPYIASQCAGALVASALMRLLFAQHQTLGATLPAGSATDAATV